MLYLVFFETERDEKPNVRFTAFAQLSLSKNEAENAALTQARAKKVLEHPQKFVNGPITPWRNVVVKSKVRLQQNRLFFPGTYRAEVFDARRSRTSHVEVVVSPNERVSFSRFVGKVIGLGHHGTITHIELVT